MLFIQLLCLILLTITIPSVDAQFPHYCTTPEALQTRTCCPLWNGSPCGFSSGRGVCAPLPARDLPKPVDYRVNWPRAFYDSVCTCWGNYDGFDCSQCLPGWRGTHCLQRHHVERKEITDLSETERETFFKGLHQAKHNISSRYTILTSNDTTVEGNYEFHNTSVYNLYVWIHYYSAKNYAPSENNAAHKGPAFVFWHRLFLLFIEREIRELTGNQHFYIPYWDCTRTDHCNICNNKYIGESLQDGRLHSASPFSKWKESLGIICLQTNGSNFAHLIRKPGRDPNYKTLPTAADVEETMAADVFDNPPFDKTSKNSFRSKLEGFEIPKDSRRLNASMHNLIHRYFNGTMSLVPTAANDPIYMLHHCYIDKLSERWLQDHPETSYPDSEQIHPAQRAEAYMAPFFPLHTNNFYWGKDTNSLGYRGPTFTGVQWHWPVVGVCGVVLLCATVVAVVNCKAKNNQKQDTELEENRSELDFRTNSLYVVWRKDRNQHDDIINDASDVGIHSQEATPSALSD